MSFSVSLRHLRSEQFDLQPLATERTWTDGALDRSLERNRPSPRERRRPFCFSSRRLSAARDWTLSRAEMSFSVSLRHLRGEQFELQPLATEWTETDGDLHGRLERGRPSSRERRRL